MGVAQSSKTARRKPARNAIRDLRGIGRDMFTAVGGGERWLRKERAADTALRIGRALTMTPEFWLNLQRMYDLDRARAAADVSTIKPLVATS